MPNESNPSDHAMIISHINVELNEKDSKDIVVIDWNLAGR